MHLFTFHSWIFLFFNYLALSGIGIYGQGHMMTFSKFFRAHPKVVLFDGCGYEK